MGTFEQFNFVEGIVWFVMAGIFCFGPFYRQKERVWRKWTLALALAVFGLTDWVEIQTGAWFRPWWLLMINAICVMVIAYFLVELLMYLRDNP